jgi:hypothetical protein
VLRVAPTEIIVSSWRGCRRLRRRGAVSGCGVQKRLRKAAAGVDNMALTYKV